MRIGGTVKSLCEQQIGIRHPHCVFIAQVPRIEFLLASQEEHLKKNKKKKEEMKYKKELGKNIP